MRRAVTLVAVASAVLALAAPAHARSAGAKADGYKSADQHADGGVTVVAGRDGSVSQPATRGGTLDCRIHELRTETVQVAIGEEATGLEEGIAYWLLCDDADGDQVVSRLFLYEPGTGAISPEQLAARARNQLPLLHPEPRTSPAIELTQLVGIDTWMWVEASQWEPLTATATIPGLSVTAVATPVEMAWDMGDGTVVTCDGPGTAYDPTLPESLQSTGCSHLYQSSGAYDATATITWSVAWTSSDGDGDQLADARRTTQFPMVVRERQAVGN